MVAFDTAKEKELLKELKKMKTPFDKHFVYIELQDFYYKYRDLDIKYLKLCEEYCLKDIEALGAAEQSYIDEQVASIAMYIDIRGNVANDLAEIQQVKEDGFYGYIPAFKRLAIIEEKRENYAKAILYCDIAIRWYSAHKINEYTEEFKKRKMKLYKKISKPKN